MSRPEGQSPEGKLTSAGRWQRWLPGLQLLKQYDPAWFRHDLAAGLVLATMLVPVGIAYATASGVPGIYGLYCTIVGLLAYAVFGPSRILVLGPDSSLAPVILAVVLPLSAAGPPKIMLHNDDAHAVVSQSSSTMLEQSSGDGTTSPSHAPKAVPSSLHTAVPPTQTPTSCVLGGPL